jgi:hypothetical protein
MTSAVRTRAVVAAAGALLTACFAATCWRASLESSLWGDEVYSLVLAAQSPGRVVELSGADWYPPGYYLALSGWMELGRLGDGEPGILWARGLNLLVWALLAVGTWTLSRRLLGPTGGALLAVAVAGGSAATQWAIDLRGYAPVFAAATVGLLLLVLDLVDSYAGGRLLLWTAYGLLAATALWCHLLAIPLFALLGLGWLVCRLRAGGPRRWRGLLPGLGAHLGALVLFLPWLVRVGSQTTALRATRADWMTPASIANLANVFLYWFPLGRLSGPANPPLPGLAVLGVLTVAMPAAALLAAKWRWSPEARPSAASLLAGLGLCVAACFSLLLWLAALFDLAPVFYGPRYPLLAAGLWAAGLTGLALRAGSTFRGRELAVGVALGPWLLAGGIGQFLLARDEPRRGLAGEREAIVAAAVAGGPAFAFPSELIPFFRHTLGPLHLRPIEDLPCSAQGQQAITVVDLNPWPGIDRLRDRLAARAVTGGWLVHSRATQRLPKRQPLVAIHRLKRLDPAALDALCARGWTPQRRAVPARAVAVALAEDQARSDGWSYLEIAPDLAVGRWGSAESGRLRFRGSLSPGRYVVHLAGIRRPQPAPSVEVSIGFEGGVDRRVTAVGPGRMELELPLVVGRKLRDPVLLVHHPTWSPQAALGTSDRRTLTFFFDSAWIEPAPASG